jgi:hypothetical protein
VRLIIALAAYLDRERVGIVIPSPSDVELEPEFITNRTSSSFPLRSGDA